jgi:hypothetical protein
MKQLPRMKLRPRMKPITKIVEKSFTKNVFLTMKIALAGNAFESGIDSKFTESRDELYTYNPLHILIQIDFH